MSMFMQFGVTRAIFYAFCKEQISFVRSWRRIGRVSAYPESTARHKREAYGGKSLSPYSES